MADDIRPITLQEEENKRINIKKQIQNISNQYEEIYGNILGEKQVDVTTTMDEDLESAFKPFVDSNKYNQKELKIIKDHLLNTLKNERASRGMGKETYSPQLKKQPPMIKFGKLIKKKVPKWFTEEHKQEYGQSKFLEFNKNSFTNYSFGSSVVPSNSTSPISYYDDEVFEIYETSDYKDELEKRKENKYSSDLDYLRVYNDETFGLDTDNEYVEIDGIRRSLDENGDFKYEIYNIQENVDENNNPIIGENLELASEEQIESFEDKYYEYEYNAVKNSIINDPLLTASSDTEIDAYVSSSIDQVKEQELNEKVNKEVEKVIESSNIVEALETPEDIDKVRDVLKKAFSNVHGTKSDRIRLRRPLEIPNSLLEELEKKGINVNIYEQGENVDFSIIFNLDSSMPKEVVYRNPMSEDYTITNYMEMKGMLKADQYVKEIKELMKNVQLKFDKDTQKIRNKTNKVAQTWWKNKALNDYSEFLGDAEDGDGFFVIEDQSKENIDRIISEYKKAGIKLKIYDSDFGKGIDYKDAAAYYSSRANYYFENDEGYKKLLAVAESTQEELMKNYSLKFKPEYKYLDTTITDFINEKLKSSGFHNANTYDKAMITDNIWLGLKEYIMLSNPVEKGDFEGLDKLNNMILKLRDEFYFSMFHNHLAFRKDYTQKATQEDVDAGVATEVGGPVYAWSVFALKDFARDLVSPEHINLSDMINKASGNDKKRLKLLRSFAEEIIDADEDTLFKKDGSFESFMKGFTSNKWYEYLPYAGSIVGINDSRYIKKSAERIRAVERKDALNFKKSRGIKLSSNEKEELKQLNKLGPVTASDQLMMDMYTVKNMMDGIFSESSTAYNAGKITADMLPYLPEFALSSPAFTWGKGASLHYGKQVLNASVKGGLLNPGASMFGVNALAFSVKTKNTLSWLLGTGAQTAVNPQMYIKYTIENMTPEMQFAFSEQANDIYNALDGTTSVDNLEEGEIYTANNGKKSKFSAKWTGQNPDGFFIAFARAYGVSWAEMATERIGSYLPGAFKYMTNDQLAGSKTFMQAVVLKQFMGTKKFTNWLTTKNLKADKKSLLRYITENSLGWNGLLSEIAEETINQPLSSLIMGRPMNEAFVDNEGNFDPTFFKEMGIAMTVTSLTFGAGNYVQIRRNLNKKKKK